MKPHILSVLGFIVATFVTQAPSHLVLFAWKAIVPRGYSQMRGPSETPISSVVAHACATSRSLCWRCAPPHLRVAVREPSEYRYSRESPVLAEASAW